MAPSGGDHWEPLAAWMEARRGTGGGAIDLYGDLAPVFDFVVRRRYDHDAIAAFIEREASADAAAVAVGACGAGTLLARLAQRFDTAVGVDASPAMLAIAANRADAPLVRADLRTFVAPGRFDAYVLLGNSLAHLGADADRGGAAGPQPDAGGVAAALARARESLAPGGVFVCDFITDRSLTDGYVDERTVASDRFRVKRTVVTTREPAEGLGVGARLTHAFAVTGRERGDTVRAGTSTPIRGFRPASLLGAAMSAGFTEVTTVDPPTPHRGGLVARRPE